MTALLCGNRFGRGLVRPGGTLVDLDEALAAELGRRLEETMKDLRGAAELLFGAATVLARFEATGRVDPATAESLGLVGPAARACGIDQDVRRDHPTGIYRFTHVPVMTAHDGDVNARAFVRWLEAQRSYDFVKAQLASLPKGTIRAAGEADPPGARRRLSRRGVARRDLPRRRHGRRRAVLALQGRRPLVPQLDGPGDGAPKRGDLRLPALQQELQPLLLRARPVRRRR